MEFDTCSKHDGNASIDRIDSSKGYTKDNIQIVTKTINLAKRSLSDDDFIQMCLEVSEYRLITH